MARTRPRARGHEGRARVGAGLSLWAILVAAGKGDRLGADLPKAFVPFRGRPLLAASLERLELSPWVDAIVVVAPPEWEEPAILVAEELGAGKVSACVTGGESRAQSVRIGVEEIPDEVDVILVHDAARPLLTDAVIERVLAPLSEGWDGAVPGLPLADTVKRVDREGTVLETVDRSGLVAVQTPQAFLGPMLRRALRAGRDDASDCAGLVEAAGGRVRVVTGDPGLLKVTTTEDLEAVENLARE